MTDSQGMTQNSQQFVSQRLNPQQMEPQRSNAQVLTQRPNVNQTGSVVRTPSQQNSQGIQNLSRVPKPSQQSNKNTTQGRLRLQDALHREGLKRKRRRTLIFD